MAPDGTYSQRKPTKDKHARGSQETFIDDADDRHQQAAQMKRRRPRRIGRRLRRIR